MSKAFRFYATDGEGETVTVALVLASSMNEAYARGWAMIPTAEACEILERLDGGKDWGEDESFFTVDELETHEDFVDAVEDYLHFVRSRSTIV
jgi:hypothetical protein